nr:methyltransferase domain-containing protein [uncultured Niameybacter sp.]
MENDKYTSYFDIGDINNSHAIAVNMIGFNKSVLEIGCSSGFVSKALKERGCTVVGIDIDECVLEEAKKYCDEAYCMNVEKEELLQILGGRKFDVIYFGDVLEHLKNPENVLQKCSQLLTSEGFIVASIPNIAHGSVRLKLLEGKFEYTDIGLLDKTHVRFFTKESIEQMFKLCDYTIIEYETTRLDYFQTEISIDLRAYDESILKYISSDPESYVYQYIVKAYKNNIHLDWLKLAKTNQELQIKVNELIQKNHNQDIEINKYIFLLKEKEQEYNLLSDSLEEQKKQLLMVKKEIQNKIEDINNLLEEKEQIINNYTKQIDESNRKLEEKEKEIKEVYNKLNCIKKHYLYKFIKLKKDYIEI